MQVKHIFKYRAFNIVIPNQFYSRIICKDCTTDETKGSALNGVACSFAIDYSLSSVKDVLDTHK